MPQPKNRKAGHKRLDVYIEPELAEALQKRLRDPMRSDGKAKRGAVQQVITALLRRFLREELTLEDLDNI